MFPRGPRFAPEKVPDVPGPGTYNPNLDTTEAYKRGAFLEKADRFDKDKISDVPGPGMYNTDSKLSSKPSSNGQKTVTQNDKYAALQRKLEQLEVVHTDSKKSHQAELERLKLELGRCQKTTTEQTDRTEKLKKQNDTLDLRIQEYKKTDATQQAELKDLRVKLRLAEHERNQLSTKQGEASEAQKALHALQSRRKDELREKDRKITELEKSLATEKRKRDVAEARLQDIKGNVDGQVEEARLAVFSLEERLNSAQETNKTKELELTELHCREDDLCTQLEQMSLLLGRVAEEYGRLASTSVRSSIHESIKRDHVSLQLRQSRLERKLANSEAQVVELANLVRCTKEDNAFLKSRLQDVEQEAAFYSSALTDAKKENESWHTPDRALEEDIRDLEHDIQDARADSQDINSSTELICEFYQLLCEQLIQSFSDLDQALKAQQEHSDHQATNLLEAENARRGLKTQLEALQSEYQAAKDDLSNVAGCLEELKASEYDIRQQLEAKEAEMKSEISKAEQRLKTEREAVHRSAATLQQAKLAEQSLQNEIEQMTSELAQAERYQEAYNSLVEEVGALVARNQLAEEEADRLSRFNAEILGHQNPAQRIMYVDRIRRELAEVKQKLLVSTLDHEAVTADNEDLRHELGMYKSVMVPVEQKPRSVITRVGRVPLGSQNMNVKPASSMAKLVEKVEQEREWVGEGDMTLDELM